MNILFPFLFFVNRNEFGDFIFSVWMNLKILCWNDYLFLF